MESLVQVCLPKSIGENGMIHYVPAECDQITCSGMSAQNHRPEWNDTINSCLECLVQLCLPQGVGQNGMIY